MVDIYGIHVGEYTSHMDVMGLSFAEYSIWFQVQIGSIISPFELG